MKELVCYILPVIIIFFLIGVIESAMLFEKDGEEITSSHPLKTIYKK